MKRKLLLAAVLVAASVIGGGNSLFAQTDVTSTYLKNAGFDTEADYQTGNLGVNPISIKDVTEWTSSASSSWTASGCIQFGGSGQINGTSIPSTNSNSEATGGAVALTGAWNGGSGYASYTQEVTLPAGLYQLVYKVNNVGKNSNFRTSLFGFTTASKNYYGSTTSYPVNTWITETVSFTLEEATTGNISLGFGWPNTGSGNTPKLVVDYVKLYYTDPELGAAQIKLQGAVKKATALNAILEDADLTTEISSATSLLSTSQLSSELNTEYSTLSAIYDALTTISLSNAGFDTESDWQTGNVAASGSANSKDVTDWTSNGGAGWCSSASFGYGTGQINGVDVPSADIYGLSNGGMLGLSLGWGGTVTYKQTIDRKLPAGKYILYYEAYNGNTGASKVGTNLIGLAGHNSAVTDFGTGTWNAYATEIDLTASVTGAELVVGATGVGSTGSSGSAKFVVDNVTLYQIETIDIADEDDYAALNEAIDAKTGKTLGFDAGEYAPYNNVDVIAALTAANAVDQEAENTKEYVQGITTALTNATWTANEDEVNAIYDGQFATTAANSTSGDITLPGWTKVGGIRLLVKDATTDPGLTYTDGQAAVFSWGGTTLTYGEQTGYTLPLNKYSVYELTLKVSGWRDGDLPNYVAVSLDGASQNVAPSVGRINDAEGNPFVTLKFYVTPTADNSVLTVYSNHHFAIADLSLKLAVAEDLAISESADYTPAETYADVTLARTIKADTWNTFVVPFNLSNDELVAAFGESVAVAEFSESSDDAENVTVNFNTMATPAITANTPVLLKGAAGTSFKFSGKLIKTGEAKVAGNYIDFVGTYAATTDIAEGDYFIASDKLYKSAGSTTIAGTRAYLNVKDKENGAKVRMIIDDEATGIEGIAADAVQNGKVYDLSGRLVKNPTKGLYIQNGKKYFVK